MYKMSLRLLTGLLLLLAVTLSAHAQDREARLRARLVGRAGQLVDEILILNRLVALQLTDEQLDATIHTYDRFPPEPEAPDAALVKLEGMKQRLLSGTPMVATDLAALRQLTAEMVRRKPGPAPQPAQELSPLGQALWDLLTVTQQAALLGEASGPAANNQKASRQVALRAIKLIGQWRRSDEAQWLVARDRLAAALARAAGPADSPQTQNCRLMFADFLDRIRTMPEADFGRRQDELAAELQALVPPGGSITVSLAEFDGRLIVAAMAATFLAPRGREMLKELRQARQPAE